VMAVKDIALSEILSIPHFRIRYHNNCAEPMCATVFQFLILGY